MADLRLSLACGQYDRTLGLIDGSIRPEGIELTYLRMSPPEIFGRMLRFHEFDACEMSLSAHMILTSRREAEFVGIPIFPGRSFRHSYVFVNAASGISTPEDLRGRRVGVPEYHMTAALFIRGMLADDHDVHPHELEWFQGGVERPGRIERIELDLPADVRIRHVPDRTLDDMLREGELDALLAAAVPRSFREGDPRIVRLFGDSRAVEEDWFRRTGIFPIMHLVVISRRIYEEHPWVAVSLTDAFRAAKEALYGKLRQSGTSIWALPFYRQELEETVRLFGEDFVPYGVLENEVTLSAALRYAREQHLLGGPLELSDLFAPNVATSFAE